MDLFLRYEPNASLLQTEAVRSAIQLAFSPTPGHGKAIPRQDLKPDIMATLAGGISAKVPILAS